MLYLIGLGLADERDITVKGLEAVRACTRVYLEAYTSALLVPKERLEAFYNKSVIVADRELVETGADEILCGAETDDVAFLVLYAFGQTVSIVFFQENWRPDSFYDRIAGNRRLGLHTLCLLDIKMKEQSMENLLRGRKIYEPPRFMTVNQCIEQLLEVEERRNEKAYTADTLCVGLARVGAEDQKIVAGSMAELRQMEFGPPLHSFIITGHLHFLEVDLLKVYAVNPSSIQEHAIME